MSLHVHRTELEGVFVEHEHGYWWKTYDQEDEAHGHDFSEEGEVEEAIKAQDIAVWYPQGDPRREECI